MSTRLVRSERVDDHTLVVTLDRAERRNAFNSAMAYELEAVLDGFESDPTLRVAVITGAGGTFSAGQDLVAARDGDFGRTPRRGGFGIMRVPPDKPLIAAVEGHALAGGFELCLSCDLIVAAAEARMGLPEAARALLAAGGGLFRLPKRIPYHVAMELALTGEPVPAAQLHAWGLVNRTTDPGQALSVALELASKVAAAGPLATAASKQIIRHAYDWSEDEAWERQRPQVDRVYGSADFQEGLIAFAEKRPAAWTGR